MGQKSRYSISSWTPTLVKEFLKTHEFEFLSRNGDEMCWVKGKEVFAVEGSVNDGKCILCDTVLKTLLHPTF